MVHNIVFIRFDNCCPFKFSVLLKAASACVAYDVCINPGFFEKIKQNAKFMGFFMSLVIDGLEEKYSLRLDRSILIFFLINQPW
jgi:hypothetical protein